MQELKVVIDLLAEIEEVLPEVRDLEVYKQAWAEFHDYRGGDDYASLGNKALAIYLQKVMSELGQSNGELVGLGGNLYGIFYQLPNDLHAVLTDEVLTINKGELLEENIDNLQLNELTHLPLRERLRLAVMVLNYYNHPRNN